MHNCEKTGKGLIFSKALLSEEALIVAFQSTTAHGSLCTKITKKCLFPSLEMKNPGDFFSEGTKNAKMAKERKDHFLALTFEKLVMSQQNLFLA